MADRCAGLTGERLTMCRLTQSMGGVPRWMGAIAILFGILVIWQTSWLAWLIGGLAIIFGVLLMVARRQFILPAILVLIGVILIAFPSILLYAVVVLFVIVGIGIAIQKPTTKLRQAIGLAGAVIGLLFLIIPSMLGIITGLVLIVAGFIILLGGLEE